MSNTVNALNSNLGSQARKRNDLVITPRLDYQASPRDGLFLSLNVNRFNSPGGVITDPTSGNYGTQTLANATCTPSRPPWAGRTRSPPAC